MKVILTKDLPKLGRFGDIVVVKDGYARNYLIPQGFAKPSSEGNMRAIEALKKKQQERLKKLKQEAEALGKRISASSYTVTVKAGKDDKLFGSVTPEMIQKAFESEGINIDKKKIVIDEPIKKLGRYNIQVKLHPEVVVECKLWVMKE